MKDNLENQTILVTGGAGFIGSALVRKLLEENANVIVFDNMLIGDESNLDEVKSKIKIIKGDIRDSNFANILIDNDVGYVFHLAAEPYIPHCYQRPKEFIDVNFMGSFNVFDACKKARVKRCLQYSTSEVYGTARQTPMDEFHITNPLSTYAVSKLAADRLAYTLHHEQRIPIVILRQFNCFGERETQPYVIPEMISQLTRGNKVILGNIHARRDFTFVDDAAIAAFELIKYEEAEGQVFNSGSGKDWSIEELAHLIGELCGHDKITIEIDQKRLRPLDVEALRCNYFKLNQLTGWKPQIDIKEGLKRTIEWFVKHQKKWIWEKRFPLERVWGKPIYEES